MRSRLVYDRASKLYELKLNLDELKNIKIRLLKFLLHCMIKIHR